MYEYGVNLDSSVAPLSSGSIAAGIYPAAVIRNQENVYAINVGDGTISQYTIASDNTLAAKNPATIANPGMHTLGAAPTSAVIDASGSYLYVVNTADNTLSQFSIAQNGQLSPMTPSAIATGTTPIAIVSVLVADSSTQYYYVLNSGAPGDPGSISIFADSGQNGALTLIDAVATGTNPTSITVNSVSPTVDVTTTCTSAQCNGTIEEFSVGANASLTDTGTIISTGSQPVNLTVNANGPNSYAYVISNGAGADANAGTLWQYTAQNTGQLTPLSPASVSMGSTAIAQYVEVNSLMVLTATTGSGGTFNFYALGTDGVVTLNNTATIDAPNPTAMAVHMLLAP